jgi:adenylate cyclase
MPAKLQVTPSGQPAYEITIGNTASIGRTSDNTVALLGSQHVSRQHAVIRCHNGFQYQIMDLGSRNGTYVNDQRVVLPITLEHGTTIRIANNELVFLQEDDLADDGHGDLTLAATNVDEIPDVRCVSLLVCDIRGFSTMSEKIAPPQLAQFLGAWFREASNLVHQTNGTIDKFIGDAMLAYWPEREGRPTESEIALEVGSRLLNLANGLTWVGFDTPFRITVALHHGRVTCGNIGVVAQRDATIIGDAVNTVFRLESTSKTVGKSLVFSQDFRDNLPEPPPLADLGEHELKGKRQHLRVYGLA